MPGAEGTGQLCVESIAIDLWTGPDAHGWEGRLGSARAATVAVGQYTGIKRQSTLNGADEGMDAMALWRFGVCHVGAAWTADVLRGLRKSGRSAVSDRTA